MTALRVMVNGQEVTITRCADECDYCGEIGHTWHAHAEARADVATWRKAHAAEIAQ